MAAANAKTPEFAEDFAAFSSALTLETMPEAAIEAARTDIFDTLACAIAGVTAKGVPELIDLVSGWGGAGQSQIWCTGARVPAHHAAWVNGMMSHARDFDDTHDGAVLHAGVSVVPAAIAAAELNPKATGADLLAGVVAGLELISRLGVSTTVGIIESGYMYTSLFGHFAATAAAARVMGLNEAQTVNALGVAYSQAAGNHQVTRDAALTKRMQPGFAAKTGLISAQLSLAGIRGAQRSFEGEDGLFRTYLHGRYQPERLREGLGRQFDFTELSFKPYPCCRFNHTAIDAALQLREKLGGAPGDIRRITANVTKQSYEAVGTPVEIRKAPETIVQAQFSIPYTVATALIKGAVGLVDFTDEALHSPEIRALAQRIDVRVDEEIEREWGRNVSPTWLVAETDNGSIEARVDQPRGNATSPMSRADFDAKLAGCLEISGINWPTDIAGRLHAALDGLPSAANAQTLVATMTPP